MQQYDTLLHNKLLYLCESVIYNFYNYVHQRLKIQSATPSKFALKDGPFMQGLEDALHSCGIDRQAYHGRTFIGNHVHKCLRVSHHQSCKYVYNNYYSIDSIEVYSVPQYNIIIDQEYTATDSCSTETAAKLNTLKDEAAAIRTTFEQLLNSFASCNSYCSLQCNYYLYYKTTILCRYKC